MSLALNCKSSLPELSLNNCSSIPVGGPHTFQALTCRGPAATPPLEPHLSSSSPPRPGVSDVLRSLPNTLCVFAASEGLEVGAVLPGQKQEKMEPGRWHSWGCPGTLVPAAPTPRGGQYRKCITIKYHKSEKKITVFTLMNPRNF